MCGFLGEFSNSLIDKSIFKNFLSLSNHRGPDAQSIWSDNKYCRLGFNRLAILDLSSNGMQPLKSPSERYVFVFNGEIYNYKALQKKYSIPSAKLRSGADSEIIAQLLDRISFQSIVNELNGMFAIAVYDTLQHSITLVRDFSGIKPLFYGIDSVNKTVVFASQFDQVFRHPNFFNSLSISHSGLYDFLALGYMQAPNTIFENIYQVEPGEIIHITSEFTIEKKHYQRWSCTSKLLSRPETSAATLKQLDQLLSETVADQLVADVPVGLFLSGGIDSPLIASYVCNHKSDITAYTISVSDPQLNESKLASEYAKKLNIKHVVAHFTEAELLNLLEDHFKKIGEPLGDYSTLPTYLITKIARQDNAVMLSGDGGDELFWGYPRFYYYADHLKWFFYPSWIRKPSSKILRKIGITNPSYAVSVVDELGDWILDMQSHNKPHFLSSIINSDFTFETQNLYNLNGQIKNNIDLLHWLRWNEFYAHLQRVLSKVDRMSMANSLEVRVPFLDKRIVDFAWTIFPEPYKTNKEPKWILKELLAQKVGWKNIDREKRGFTVPIKSWLLGPLKNDVFDAVIYSEIFGDGIVNATAIKKYVLDFYEQKSHINEWGVWIIYTLQKWAKINGFVN
ncbi:asparagine synthase (glutamine-hydrolyzing) [Thermaurantimonas aggregans]|uniref:asparagine synthase (glutamine-hydrolyzing) n=1 Tax=Thermaurantimonas aggregans TaxID=2173829 RepID=UPI0023F493CF|nr:asparagine synthase (glutamine-hydrolyzing) [Thermaurantimonas aggregans]MCX8148580.1 asparagine synthase (glutamine-hydrolyzing) [Thermaurantimonas aggregans]